MSDSVYTSVYSTNMTKDNTIHSKGNTVSNGELVPMASVFQKSGDAMMRGVDSSSERPKPETLPRYEKEDPELTTYKDAWDQKTSGQWQSTSRASFDAWNTHAKHTQTLTKSRSLGLSQEPSFLKTTSAHPSMLARQYSDAQSSYQRDFATSNASLSSTTRPRDLVLSSATRELHAGTAKASAHRIPGYGGYVPRSSHNAANITGKVHAGTTTVNTNKDNLIETFRGHIPGYTGYQANSALNASKQLR